MTFKNEILQLMAHTVLRKIVANAGKQQFYVCIQWVGTDHVGLDMHRLRGQYYDGASVMSGNVSGVAARIYLFEPTTEDILKMIHDVLLRVGLDMHRLRGQ